MVFDQNRNEVYRRAIEAIVTPESVVLDLGAGLGIHGLIAARCGARKVYLVDPAPVVLQAEQVAQSNGLDNVEVIQSTIQAADIPEQVDLIISVFTGVFLLNEDLLPGLFYAREKYLKPGGHLLPDCAVMNVAAVSAREVYEESVSCWSDNTSGDSPLNRFNLDYELIRPFANNRPIYTQFNNTDFKFLTEPTGLAELDFRTAMKAECFAEINLSATQKGTCHGWLGWFDMRLGQDWLSTSPASEVTHWNQALLPLESPVEIQAGEEINLSLTRPEYSDWTWISAFRGRQTTFSQSTFLSNPLSPNAVLKSSPTHRPILSAEGRALMMMFNLFDGQHALDEIASRLYKSFPDQFLSEEDALALTRNHSQRLS